MSDHPAREPQTLDLRLRPFAPADDDEVTSWFADAGELRFFAGPRLRWPLDRGQWRSIRLDPSVSSWTATLADDDTPVGHGELVIESEDSIRLARFAIAPSLRGRGIGRAMLPLLIVVALEHGAKVMTVAVHPDNTNAITSYRTLGFEPSESPASAGRISMELNLDKHRG